MPSHYWYHCTKCEYRAYRYRNVKRCPDCGAPLIREESSAKSEDLPTPAQNRMLKMEA